MLVLYTLLSFLSHGTPCASVVNIYDRLVREVRTANLSVNFEKVQWQSGGSLANNYNCNLIGKDSM